MPGRIAQVGTPEEVYRPARTRPSSRASWAPRTPSPLEVARVGDGRRGHGGRRVRRRGRSPDGARAGRRRHRLFPRRRRRARCAGRARRRRDRAARNASRSAPIRAGITATRSRSATVTSPSTDDATTTSSERAVGLRLPLAAPPPVPAPRPAIQGRTPCMKTTHAHARIACRRRPDGGARRRAQTLNVATAGDQNMVDYVKDYLGPMFEKSHPGVKVVAVGTGPGDAGSQKIYREARRAEEGRRADAGISTSSSSTRRWPAQMVKDGLLDEVPRQHRDRQAGHPRHRDERARHQRVAATSCRCSTRRRRSPTIPTW